MSTLGSLKRLVVIGMATAGCGGGGPNTDAGLAGAVPGPEDRHCVASDGGAVVQETRASSCQPGPDAGTAAPEHEHARFNAEADDDDCKYHVGFTSTRILQGEVWFTVKVTGKTDGARVVGAETRAEAFLSDVHPAPYAAASTSESTPGTYVLGPVKFDAPGRWTVRLHFFSGCSRALEDSPHSHVAFLIDVP